MSRYIDTEWLEDNAKEYSLGYYEEDEWAIPLDVLDSAPSIDIVRCKECKHYNKFPTWSACTYWSGDPYEQASVNADDFCSYGEREGEA